MYSWSVHTQDQVPHGFVENGSSAYEYRMKLDDALKTSLQEIRMQMLGTQVLFGFQLQALFQDRFSDLSPTGRFMDGASLAMIILVMSLLLAVPSQHRIVENGESSQRLFRMSLRYANWALYPLAGAIAADIYVAVLLTFGTAVSTMLATALLLTAAASWIFLALSVRRPTSIHELTVSDRPTPLHTKIEQMLTEARVILPGAQALLGFQLTVMMTKAFAELPRDVQIVHVIALMSLGLTIVLLIAPAAIHRIGFQGQDDPRLHSIGSVLITAALLPLAAGLACDVWVALTRLFNASLGRTLGAALVAALLFRLVVCSSDNHQTAGRKAVN